jgi:hypothetical protein
MFVGAARVSGMISGHAGFRNRVCTPAFRRAAGESSFQPKNSKTTPCTVGRLCEINDLLILRNSVDPSGKTGA